MMVVIAIIGILASIAIPQYVRFQMKSRTAEAKGNLAAIRTAQAAHFTEFGNYVSAAAVPATVPGSVPASFLPLTPGFLELGFDSTGKVLFQYAISLSGDGTGYTAEAVADLDTDSAYQAWVYPMPTAAGAFVSGPILCDPPAGSERRITPCATTHGQSVF
jgi:type IV pilus assembly protein PilA